MRVSDEELGAYLDGECDAAEAARIAALIESDGELAARAERLRRDMALVQQAFAGMLDEPVPAALRAAVTPPEAAAEGTKVVDFAAARAARRPRWLPPLAMAASVALGVVVGAVGFNGPAGDREAGLIMAATGRPVAGPELAATLASARSGTSVTLAEAVVKPVLSFRDETGRLCRQFSLRQAQALTNGIACAEGGSWRMVVLAEGVAAEGGEFVTAAGPAEAAIEATLDALMMGEPLDAAAEAAALKAAGA